MAIKEYKPAIICASVLLFIYITYSIFNIFYLYQNDAFIEAKTIQVKPEVSGQVTEVLVKDLQFVKTGQVLFKIEAKPYEDALNSAIANVAIQKNRLQSLLAQKRLSTERIKNAQTAFAFQSKEYARYKKLAESGNVPQEKEDSALYYYQQAKNNLAIAKESLVQVEAELGPEQQGYAPLKKSESDLKLAQFKLSKTTVRSMIDGYVTAMRLYKGDFVAAGKPLFALVDDSKWWVFAKIKEDYLKEINNKSVSIYLASGETFEGKVSGIAWAVNRLESGGAQLQSVLPYLKKTEYWINLAQRFPVKITFAGKGKHLRVGSSARLLIRLK